MRGHPDEIDRALTILGGAVAWVATVVGMSVVPLLHTLFGTY